MDKTHPFTIRSRGTPELRREDGQAIIQYAEQIGQPFEYIASIDTQPVFGLQPLAPMKLVYASLDDELRLSLSQHARQRLCGKVLVWEDVTLAAFVHVYHPCGTAIIEALVRGITAIELAQNLGLNLNEARQCLELLLCAGIARLDDVTRDTDMWSAQESWFHSQSMLFHSDRPCGGSFPYQGIVNAPSAKPQIRQGNRTDLRILPYPVMDFAKIVARRKSRRNGENPLDLDRLSLLLQMSAKATGIEQQSGEDAYEIRRHSYPTGGGMGELEIYLLISHCDGIAAGLYQYDSIDHALINIAPAEPAIMEVLNDHAKRATGAKAEHDAILFITSRIDRSFWKYEGLSYRLSLLAAGALIQNIELVSTALDLAACPVGVSLAEAFAKRAGINIWKEPLISQIVING